MDHRSQRAPSYSNLFNLESLTNFRLPCPDDDRDTYSNNSHHESRSSQDEGTIRDRYNGAITSRSSERARRQQRSLPEGTLSPYSRRDTDSNSNSEDYRENGISEEHYRSMLGLHMQQYKKPKLNSSSNQSPSRLAIQPIHKRGHGTKAGKFGDDHLVSVKMEMTPHEVGSSPEYYEADYDLEYSASREPLFLDIGEGITYKIPPTYDKLVDSLKLPSYADIRVEEYFLQGTLDLQTLAAMISTDRKFESQNRGGLAEPRSKYESLQSRLKTLSASNSSQKFSLQVCDTGLDPFYIPEGAAGRIQRLILNEAGTLQVYYVKVLERGDTYEIIERSLPKEPIVQKGPDDIEREEMEKVGKMWAIVTRRDIPRYHRTFTSFHRKRLGDHKRWWEACQREVKVKVSRSQKLMKAAPIRTRKLARDMLIFWKRVDKEEAELKKKKEKEDAEALKRAEEAREAKRQQQRLNFLLSQTELYSHFMQNKPNSQPFETSLMEDGEPRGPEEEEIVADLKPGEEEDPEEAELKREALRAAQQAVSQQKKITNAFDSECIKLRQGDVATVPEGDATISGSTNIDLLNPSTMPQTSSVQTPEMFRGCLKEYQLKGLQWLVNCYEQGLNGILADEMGLGKTIQAMAFLAHLAEEKNIWGPFLVVAPASVLNNWAEEVSRFCPDLKTLPYWGGLPERGILRKNINPKRLYRRDSGFHILITSYQLLVTDEKYLRRVKWQYMVLDEAQAIKSSTSIRWKTLLSFNCRNRLLLTGTPIQNNMAELWALLHFIMPTLFDSHEQFNEWFSKGIENHAEHGGTLNEHQLNRLHAVLKPFMLRRVKKDVITELTSKTEVTVHCKLSSRQQEFYQAIKNKISLAELLDGSRGRLNEKKIVNLMNIVIQLRKVCNHPELFERNEGSSYLYFGEIPNSLLSSYQDQDCIHYAGNWNPITYKVPKLVYQEIVRNDEMPCSVVGNGIQHGSFERLFNIFSPENICHSALPLNGSSEESCMSGEVFGFTRLIDLSPREVSFLARCSLLERLLFSVLRWGRQFTDENFDLFMNLENENLMDEMGKVTAVPRLLLLPQKSELSILRRKLATGLADSPYDALVISHQDRLASNIRLLRSTYSFMPRARAPPINAQCPDRSFAYQKVEELHHPWVKKLFFGFARTSEFNGPRRPSASHPLIQEIDVDPSIVQPVFELPCRIFGSSPRMQSFDPAKMLTDSGKLQTLDILLKRLRAGNHRVLLFAQMTKMFNLLEDYMNYRKYKYFRLDGSTNIMDRRDMVRDFQDRNDIFVFLLSTRAGGLGINLTAADTVIFYESDWNPTLDLQAMDRAHRLGQTKEVTVYRLICKETVEEKILQRASQKNTVQQLVMTGGHVQGDLLKPEDVFSLLLDDAQLEQKLREAPLQVKDRQKRKQRASKGIRVDADGDVTLEDVNAENEQARALKESERAEHDNAKPVNKKRNVSLNKETASKLDERSPNGYDEGQPRPKRVKRAKRSINDNIESTVDSTMNYQPSSSYYG